MPRKDLMVCPDHSTHTPSPSLLGKGTFEDENKRMDFSSKNATLWSLLSGHLQRVLNTLTEDTQPFYHQTDSMYWPIHREKLLI